MKKIIKIEGMTCGKCEEHVKNALEELGEFTKIYVNKNEKIARVESLLKISNQEIIDAIEDMGYRVISIEEL